jgi:hypothetical protein
MTNTNSVQEHLPQQKEASEAHYDCKYSRVRRLSSKIITSPWRQIQVFLIKVLPC